jgi:hypothetical protein
MNPYKDQLVTNQEGFELLKDWSRPEYPWVRIEDGARGYMTIRKGEVFFIPCLPIIKLTKRIH